MRKMIKYLALIVCILMPQSSFACAAGFRQGHDLSLAKLIDQTNTIILATFNKDKAGKIGFTVNEVIKANESFVEESLKYFLDQVSGPHFKYDDSNNSMDFAGHTSKLFWENEISLQDKLVVRAGAEWHPGMCGPIFYFKQNEQYLLFLESSGSLYAAEVIKSKDDLWYKYVVEHASP